MAPGLSRGKKEVMKEVVAKVAIDTLLWPLVTEVGHSQGQRSACDLYRQGLVPFISTSREPKAGSYTQQAFNMRWPKECTNERATVFKIQGLGDRFPQ